MTDNGSEGRIREIFKAFLVLGLTSFGGPIAHLGYFRAENTGLLDGRADNIALDALI